VRVEKLRGAVPDEFLEALLLLMPDAEAGPSPGETAYFPCYDLDALDAGNRIFWAEAGAEPALQYELEVRIPVGTLRARGTWLGADPPGALALPHGRIWIVDSTAFEIVGNVRERASAPVIGADGP
jgi:hypothetical protein